MRYHEIITEGRDAPLYHGYKDGKFASMALASGQMAATSTQRFWADGRRRREKVDPDYEQSYWMKGVSFTRDIQYAMAWGEIVISVSQTKLAQRTKIIPYSWSYHMSGWVDDIQNKREREEFAIVKMTPDTYIFPDDHENAGEFDHKRFQSKNGPEGYIPLTPILEGIWMYADLGSIRGPAPTQYDSETGKHVSPGIVEKEYYGADSMAAAGYSIQQIIDHPKFRGFYKGGRHKWGDTPGFKFWPPSTPRSELPPRAF